MKPSRCLALGADFGPKLSGLWAFRGSVADGANVGRQGHGGGFEVGQWLGEKSYYYIYTVYIYIIYIYTSFFLCS